MQIDMQVMELLASKFCHDLVSPVSAINNGVELIEDIGGSVVEEAMKLIGDSAGHASRRLRLFRVAYGRAGSEENLPLKDMRQIAEQYIGAGKVTLNWPEDQPVAGARGAARLPQSYSQLAYPCRRSSALWRRSDRCARRRRGWKPAAVSKSWAATPSCRRSFRRRSMARRRSKI